MLSMVLILLSLSFAFGQKGEILKDQVLESSILNQEVYYNIYLPPNYNEAGDYPVIYYLHGFGGDHNSSNSFMETIDLLTIKNTFPETIIIAPDGKRSWYIDDYAGKFNYSTMFIQEFIPFVKKMYSIDKNNDRSAIMGISMGGFGALRFTMLYPDEFGICISFMAGISTKEQIRQDSDEGYKKYHHNLYGENLKPAERANEFFIKNNPLYIAQNADSEILSTKKWYIQVCDNDYHSLPNAKLHAVFKKLNISHEFRVLDGNHNGKCVNSSMNEALEFVKTHITKAKEYN